MTYLQGSRHREAPTLRKQAFTSVGTREMSVEVVLLALQISLCDETSQSTLHWPEKITWSHGTSKEPTQSKAPLRMVAGNVNSPFSPCRVPNGSADLAFLLRT